MEKKIIIVGAGPSGITLANLFSKIKKETLVLETRDHIGGNCYDYYHDGILVHKYGPHYFRTNKKKLINYLSEFTEWIQGDYFVKSYTDKKYYDFPINLNTLEDIFQTNLTKNKAIRLLENISEDIKNPKNSEEFIISRVGKKIYEKFYKNYTFKQWGIDAKKLHPSVCGRVPINLSRKSIYTKEKYNLMPKNGFTEMFYNMLNSDYINLKLSVNKNYFRSYLKTHTVFYTGPIDTFYNYKYGRLGWRSLKFKFETINKKFYQDFCQVNYPNNYKFTRKVEYKHVTKQKSNKTVISKEYPTSKGDPYYPIPTKINNDTYCKYKKLTEKDNNENIFFLGRLANYTYINTDQAILNSINLFNEFQKKK